MARPRRETKGASNIVGGHGEEGKDEDKIQRTCRPKAGRDVDPWGPMPSRRGSPIEKQRRQTTWSDEGEGEHRERDEWEGCECDTAGKAGLARAGEW